MRATSSRISVATTGRVPESYDWCTAHRDELSEKRSAAARAMFDKHEAEQRAATARPPRGREAW